VGQESPAGLIIKLEDVPVNLGIDKLQKIVLNFSHEALTLGGSLKQIDLQFVLTSPKGSRRRKAKAFPVEGKSWGT